MASNGKIRHGRPGELPQARPARVEEEYDPASALLTPKANIPVSTYQPGIAASADGKVYVVGGCVPPTVVNGMKSFAEK